MLAARNAAGAAVGDTVLVAVSAGSVISATLRNYLLPLVGLVLGAAVAQLAAGPLLSPAAAARVAGIGGIVGALAALLIARRLGQSAPRAGGVPTVTRVVRNPTPGGGARGRPEV